MPGLDSMHAATPPPERLGQYEVLETLAQGPSGWILFKGFDPIFRRNAALRAIPKRMLENYGTAMVARLQNEVATAARLHHPGIVGVYEYGEDSDWAFIATEFVEGSCLKEQSRVSVADAVSLVVQVLGALDFAHNQGVVHREIKPSNLLINDKGQIRIANFGIAELNVGTPSYMSPEQLSGSPVDRRSDLFSVGIILYELLTGMRPFPGSPESLVQRVCNDRERPPSNVNADVPQGFDLVCSKALAKARNERYPTARSFSDDIRNAFESKFASLPSKAVSNETVVTATLPRSLIEIHSGDSPRPKEAFRAPSSVAGSRWEDATLRTVEKQLAAYLGPLAKIIVKDAAAKAADLQQLYSLAAESLKQEPERRAFLAQKPDTGQSIHPGEPSKTPAQSSLPRAPTPGPAVRNVAPEVKLAPKPNPVPKADPNMPARVASRPEARAAAPEIPSPAKPDIKAAVKPEVKPLPKPEAAGTPQPQAKLVPPQPPTPPHAKRDVGSRLQGLLGKQPETLAGYLQDNPPQLEEVIHALVASVQALAAMHATDSDKKEALTPQSICFDHLGKATIQSLQPAVTRGTSSGASNPRYAAPEIFAEKSSGSNSSMVPANVYALGVMFYEVLLGRRLFGKTFADQRTDLDWLRWHADLESKAPQLKSLLPDYPVALSDLVESMMEKRAEKRPADLESILSRLRSIAQRANKTIVFGKTGPKAVAARSASHPLSTQRKKGRKGLVVILLFVLVLAAGGFYLWQNPDFFRTVILPFLHLSPN